MSEQILDHFLRFGGYTRGKFCGIGSVGFPEALPKCRQIGGFPLKRSTAVSPAA